MMISARLHSAAALTAMIFLAACSGAGAPSVQAPMSRHVSAPDTFANRVALNSAGALHASLKLSPIVADTGSWFDPSVPPSAGLIYASDYYFNHVAVFRSDTLQQVARIGTVCGPVGMTTDTTGDLYVTDQCREEIKVYAPRHVHTAKLIIPDTGYNPTDVALLSNGNLAVANICSAAPRNCPFDGSDQGNVTIFAAPNYTTSIQLDDGCFYCFDVAVDKNGDVWADGLDGGQRPIVGYWPPGNTNFTKVNISFKFPGGVEFDRSGNLVLNDQQGSSNGGSEVFVYPPGATQPSRSIAVQTDGTDVVGIALGSTNSRLFGADIDENSVRIFGYKAGTFRKEIFGDPRGLMVGMAVYPPPSDQ